MKPQQIKEWHVKLKVSLEEEHRIKKEAIDNNMRVAEYIKLKILTNPAHSIKGKQR
ncbi:MAG: hypothetical protein QNJ54_32055 [Prochloraceae cyanobacterium]|nr:hypothetical protein [Prochloraceae cyanobacterium]